MELQPFKEIILMLAFTYLTFLKIYIAGSFLRWY